MALFTTGLTTGLVVDCGNLETSVLPLLYEHGRFIPSSNLHLSLAPQTSIPQSLLTPNLLEDIKARALFCSPLMMMEEQHQDETPLESYKSFSSATDLYYPVTLKDNTRGTLLIPGWIRERTAEVLFEGDEDELSLPMCIMESLLKVQPDLRKPLISSMLLIGGLSLIPGFQSRLKQELLRSMRDPNEREKRHYKSLLKLHKSIGFLDNSEEKGAGRIFMNNVRGWIGGSLVGSLKLSGEEITKEKFVGNVTDWSIGNWSTDCDVLDTNASAINK
ncbi:hypothetical protein BY458DRAFT_433740 [Sporodiniella umbellata]|nr:hypothetical protein BY458DRAFT_433740 [Sporodiniella umbellata]